MCNIMLFAGFVRNSLWPNFFFFNCETSVNLSSKIDTDIVK